MLLWTFFNIIWMDGGLQTDTASVLTEAIGYIQFLHEQVQVISKRLISSECMNIVIMIIW